MLYSLLDFVERFEASRRGIDREVEKVDGLVEEAKGLYLLQSLDQAERACKSALQELHKVEEDSIRLKNRALVWIYIVEWSAVLSILMISGSALWIVMVKRRMYRSATTTRSVRQEVS